MLSLTLEEIERHTRMRAQFMDALEKGNFDELPSPVQTRGMLSNYASFLDLDVDDILLQFADALQARHRERYPEKTSAHTRTTEHSGAVCQRCAALLPEIWSLALEWCCCWSCFLFGEFPG